MKLLEEVITEENIQSLGEQIAVIAVGAKARRVLGHLDHIYKGLLYDVHKRNTPNHIFSDGYDLAQMAICFLWEHKGHRLSDYYGKDGERERLQYPLCLLPHYRQIFMAILQKSTSICKP